MKLLYMMFLGLLIIVNIYAGGLKRNEDAMVQRVINTYNNEYYIRIVNMGFDRLVCTIEVYDPDNSTYVYIINSGDSSGWLREPDHKYDWWCR